LSLKRYDYIIIDTPPTVSIFNKNALNASTDAVIPMQPEGMAVKGADRESFNPSTPQ